MTSIAPRNELIAGIQATAQTNTNHGERVIIPNADTGELSGYAYFKHAFNKLVIEEGLRYNYYTLTTQERGQLEGIGFMPEINKTFHTIDGSLKRKVRREFSLKYHLSSALFVISALKT
ncbi:hypothetical protein JW960_21365 [candidate division KSB1 bacterium]|nr:hypothetical protein [candidate division KSB1 bacterium]